jgi:hypothetical protein
MNINRDEVRRQLSESTREHAASVSKFREALKWAFDRDGSVSDGAKSELLGVPSRRSFLTVGGATVLGSAVLVGCGKSSKKALPVSGTSIPEPSSTTTIAPGSKDTDLTLLRTAQSIEVLAVETYQKAIDSGLVTTSALLEAIKLFQSQHQDHAGLLATATRDQGGTPYDTANPFLSVEVVTPELAKVTDEAGVLKLAAIVENTAAQTYTQAGGILTTPELRAVIMSIGATEARHLTVIYGVQLSNPVPLPIMPTRNAAPADSYIGPKGPVKVPTTTTTAAGA